MRNSSVGPVARNRRAFRQSCHCGAEAGFTLIELVVGVVLFAVIASVVIPALVTQISKGEVAALVKELDGIKAGTNTFYADVARYPSEINQLVFDPAAAGSSSSEVTGEETTPAAVDDLAFWDDNSGSKHAFPAGRIKRWDGPYLDVGYVPARSGIRVGLNGEIRRNFVMVCTGGSRWLAVAVDGISEDDAAEVSLHAEKSAVLGPVDVFNGSSFETLGTGTVETAAGLVRWYDSDVANDGVGTLLYLLNAVGSPGC